MTARLPSTALLLAILAEVCFEVFPASGAQRNSALMVLELRLDSTTLFQTTFPLCYPDPGAAAERPRKSISFFIKPERSILWLRESRHTVTPIATKPDQEIEVSIWTYSVENGRQSRMDSTRIAVGGSFYSDGRILESVIHLAHPQKRDRSEIAPGLVLVTYPLKPREKGRNDTEK